MEMVLNTAALALGLAAIALIGAYTVLTGSPPMPSTPAERTAALGLLPEDPQGLILELGSGFGGLARALAKQHPRSEVIGYERSPLPWLASRLWLAVRPQPNLLFVRGDFREAPLEEADVVACYLVGPLMATLGPVLARRLSAGAIVLSLVFAVPRWKPVARGEGGNPSAVYLYRVPDSLPVGGTG